MERNVKVTLEKVTYTRQKRVSEATWEQRVDVVGQHVVKDILQGIKDFPLERTSDGIGKQIVRVAVSQIIENHGVTQPVPCRRKTPHLVRGSGMKSLSRMPHPCGNFANTVTQKQHNT